MIRQRGLATQHWSHISQKTRVGLPRFTIHVRYMREVVGTAEPIAKTLVSEHVESEGVHSL
jgi:hypothetical protein